MKVTFDLTTRFEIVNLDEFLKALIKFLTETGSSRPLIIENLNEIVTQIEGTYLRKTGIDLNNLEEFE